jgi:hypothetical protein
MLSLGVAALSQNGHQPEQWCTTLCAPTDQKALGIRTPTLLRSLLTANANNVQRPQH